MPIVAKASGGSFVPAPAGTFSACCCDVVDLGTLEVNWGGKQKSQHKVRIVWQIDEVREDNKPHNVSKRYTLSLHEKSALRKDLEAWRGRSFTPQELEGFDLEVLLNVPALVNVIHETKDGKTYSNVASIMRLPKGMAAIQVRDYVRVCDREPTQSEAMPHQDWEDLNASELADVENPPF